MSHVINTNLGIRKFNIFLSKASLFSTIISKKPKDSGTSSFIRRCNLMDSNLMVCANVVQSSQTCGGGLHQEEICYNGILMNELANKAAGSLSSERKPTKLVLLFLTITRFSPSSMVYGGTIIFFPTRFKKVRHRTKMPPCGGTTSVELLVMFVEYLMEDTPPRRVEIEVQLRGGGGEGNLFGEVLSTDDLEAHRPYEFFITQWSSNP